MPVTVSPSPSDGPLSAKGPSITLTISTTTFGTVSAHVETALGPSVGLGGDILQPGTNVITFNLPPGGVPPGSTLSVIVRDVSGAKTVVTYHLA